GVSLFGSTEKLSTPKFSTPSSSKSCTTDTMLFVIGGHTVVQCVKIKSTSHTLPSISSSVYVSSSWLTTSKSSIVLPYRLIVSTSPLFEHAVRKRTDIIPSNNSRFTIILLYIHYLNYLILIGSIKLHL